MTVTTFTRTPFADASNKYRRPLTAEETYVAVTERLLDGGVGLTFCGGDGPIMRLDRFLLSHELQHAVEDVPEPLRRRVSSTR